MGSDLSGLEDALAAGSAHSNAVKPVSIRARSHASKEPPHLGTAACPEFEWCCGIMVSIDGSDAVMNDVVTVFIGSEYLEAACCMIPSHGPYKTMVAPLLRQRDAAGASGGSSTA